MNDGPRTIRMGHKQAALIIHFTKEGAHPMVTINGDGTLTYAEGYDPDEAARIFWEALARPAGFVLAPRELLEELADPEQFDLSWCAYYRRGLPDADPEGICSYGCREEPACYTSEPTEGWPARRLHALLNPPTDPANNNYALIPPDTTGRTLET